MKKEYFNTSEAHATILNAFAQYNFGFTVLIHIDDGSGVAKVVLWKRHEDGLLRLLPNLELGDEVRVRGRINLPKKGADADKR